MLPGWWIALLVFGIWVAGIFVMTWLSYRYEWWNEDVERPMAIFVWPIVLLLVGPFKLGFWIIDRAEDARKAAEDAKKCADDEPPEPRGVYR